MPQVRLRADLAEAVARVLQLRNELWTVGRPASGPVIDAADDLLAKHEGEK